LFEGVEDVKERDLASSIKLLGVHGEPQAIDRRQDLIAIELILAAHALFELLSESKQRVLVEPSEDMFSLDACEL